MNGAARVLNRVADYYASNPNAFAEGKYLALVIAGQPVRALDDKTEAIDAVRTAIGAKVGGLRDWSMTHTPAEAAVLLRGVAAEITEVDR